MSVLKLQLGFVKDSVYGALTYLLFSSFGWQQWKLSLAHGASLLCVFLVGSLKSEDEELPKARVRQIAGLCVVATFGMVIVDVVIALTLSCAISPCCEPGQTSPVFAPGMELCSGESSRIESQLVSATAIITVGVGAFQSCLRAVSLGRLVGSSGTALGLPVAYLVLRFYQFSWISHTNKLAPVAALWAAGSFFAAGAVLKSLTRRKVPFAKFLPAIVTLTDLAALATITSTSTPESLRLAGGLVQGLCLALSLWMTVSFLRTKNRPKKDDEASVGAPSAPAVTWKI